MSAIESGNQIIWVYFAIFFVVFIYLFKQYQFINNPF